MASHMKNPLFYNPKYIWPAGTYTWIYIDIVGFDLTVPDNRN